MKDEGNWNDLKVATDALAPNLIGLTTDEATAKVADAGLKIMFAPVGTAVRAAMHVGRITAWTESGRVVRAHSG